MEHRESDRGSRSGRIPEPVSELNRGPNGPMPSLESPANRSVRDRNAPKLRTSVCLHECVLRLHSPITEINLPCDSPSKDVATNSTTRSNPKNVWEHS